MNAILSSGKGMEGDCENQANTVSGFGQLEEIQTEKTADSERRTPMRENLAAERVRGKRI